MVDPDVGECIQHELLSSSSVNMGHVREHEPQPIERVLCRSVLEYALLGRADPNALQRMEQIARTIDRKIRQNL